MSLSSSDGSDAQASYYQPVLADRIKAQVSDPIGPPSNGPWPVDAMNVYTNDLFTDGELGVVEDPNAPHPPRPVNAQKIQQQKSALAARRAERIQANMYQRNSSNLNRGPGNSPTRGQQVGLVDRPSSQAGKAQQETNVYGLKSSYDPTEERNPRSALNAAPRAPPSAPLDLTNMPAFLMQPGPRDQPRMCYIVRDKGSAKMYPRYNLYLEDPKTFLLAARKRKKQTTSNYLLSLDPEDLGRESTKFFGKLRANFVGTEFTIFDGGSKGEKPSAGGRVELGAVTYQYNVLGTRGPRKMTGVIPMLDNQGNMLYQPSSEADNILDRIKANKGLEQLVVMRNKPPRWNDELNAYCLNFNGRVTEASVKNFQLVTDDNQSHVILQFGKIGKNTFTMDYMWPISAFQAFSICLSSFDNKLACE